MTTTYKYILNADQHTNGYHGKWLNLDRCITVYASDYEEAAAKAWAALPPPRTDTGGWKLFTREIAEIETVSETPEVVPCGGALVRQSAGSLE